LKGDPSGALNADLGECEGDCDNYDHCQVCDG
jgi:hypothetical protein